MIKFLIVIGWWSLNVSLGAAQSPDRLIVERAASAIKIPLLIKQKSSVRLNFRATMDGSPVSIEKISRPRATALAAIVVDCRTARGGDSLSPSSPSSPTSPTAPPRLKAANDFAGRWVWITLGAAATPGKKARVNDRRRLTAPDCREAKRQAASIFSGGRPDERQALLLIGGDALPADHPGGTGKSAAATAQTATATTTAATAAVTDFSGRLIDVITGGDSETISTRIRHWQRSLDNFYMISVAVGSIPKSGGRLRVEARSKNRLVAAATLTVAAPPEKPSDEVEAALLDYAKIVDFERMEKYPGLAAADIAFFRTHYAPGIEGVVIEDDRMLIERLRKTGAAVFRLHAIEKQCETMLLRSALPTVFTWKLTFVSLTTATLDILSDEEIIALIAHEVGHLYFAADLLKARETADERLARVTELKCDLIALATLRRLKLKETNLMSAIEKLIAARQALNAAVTQPGSPFLEDRRRLAKEFTARSND